MLILALPVAPFYQTPFEFTGTIHSLTFDVSGEVIEDSEAEMKRILRTPITQSSENQLGLIWISTLFRFAQLIPSFIPFRSVTETNFEWLSPRKNYL